MPPSKSVPVEVSISKFLPLIIKSLIGGRHQNSKGEAADNFPLDENDSAPPMYIPPKK